MMAYDELAPTTRAEHNAIIRSFQDYCVGQQVDSLPATPNTILAYLLLRSQTRSGMSVHYLAAALRSWHERNGFLTFQNEKMRLGIEAIARHATKSETRPLRPLSQTELFQYVDSLGVDAAGVRDAAMALLLFAGMMRGTELVALNVDDLIWQQRGVIVTVGGTYPKIIVLNKLPMSRYCPVRALHKWMVLLNSAQPWLFCNLSASGCGARLTTSQCEEIVRRRLHLAELYQPRMGVRSFRDGAILLAMEKGMPASTIYRHAGFRRWLFLERWKRIQRELDPRGIEDLLQALPGDDPEE